MPEKPVKWYKSLSTRKGRLQTGAFLLEGKGNVEIVTQQWPEKVLEVICIEEYVTFYSDFKVRILDKKQFASISSAKSPQGIAVVCEFPEKSEGNNLPRERGDRILLLEAVQDPGNVGTLIRTAAAFGFSGVLMSGKCADPFSPKCIQSTAGSIFALWIRRTSSYLLLAKELAEEGYFIASAVIDGTENLQALSGKDRIVIALGNESSGLSAQVRALSSFEVTIPFEASCAESLNVSVSGGILMHYVNL